MRTKTKKTIAAVLSACLVFAITAGGSLAYLTQKTASKANTFTMATTALNATLTEPTWVHTMAENLVPGSIVPKDPTITNTSSGAGAVSEWVASRISFVYASGTNAGKLMSEADLAKVLAVITVDYNADGGSAVWTRTTGTATASQQVFTYNTLVAPAEKTTALFTTVTVKSAATSAQIKAVSDIGGFDIYVEGFAAQSAAAADNTTFKTNLATLVTWETINITTAAADFATTVTATNG